MAERWLVPLVVMMMGISGLYAFDQFYGAAGPTTGFAVNTQMAAATCSDSDSNDPKVPGVTISEIYESGAADDTCVGSDLLEYYCTETGPDVRKVSCRNGCSFGACN